MNFEAIAAGFQDELEKISSELTPEGRSHVAPKNFAVSGKESNTGKPAYPIPDKAHARSALGFAAMHHDKKDISEVRKDVEKKFPGMVKKEATHFMSDVRPSGLREAVGDAVAKGMKSGVGPAIVGGGLGVLAGGLLGRAKHVSEKKEGVAEGYKPQVLHPVDYADAKTLLPEFQQHAAWAQEHPIQSRLGGAAALGIPGALLGGALGHGAGQMGTGALIGGGLGGLAGGLLGSAGRKQRAVGEMEQDLAHTEAHHEKKEKKASTVAEHMQPGTEHLHSDWMREVLASRPPTVFRHVEEEDEKTASAPFVRHVRDALGKVDNAPGEKEAGLLQRVGKGLTDGAGEHATELAGLGILAAPAADQAQAHARAALAGDYNKGGVKKREVLPHAAHPIAELAGLGVLAGPSIAHLAGHH